MEPTFTTTAEQLVAYLDGELSADEMRAVEEALSRDPQVRGKLRELQQAWDLLDNLPRSEVSDSFTHTTVEMIAVAAEEEVRQESDAAPRRRRRAWLLAGMGATVAAGLGFAVGSWLLPSPNRRLVDDLRVIEKFDQYRYVDDVEFVRLLEQSGTFSDGGINARKS